MRSLALALLLVALAPPARAAEPAIQTPQGYVTDLAHVLPPPVQARITGLVEELRAKTGAEIAVVTVPTTAPLDDFDYAMRVADAWHPGRKGEDTGVVFLVATQDRKLRVLVGYGLEGILPDGLVGEIEDREVVPAFRAGDVGDGVWRGVAELARRIGASRGVTLTGVPPPRPRGPQPVPLPGWVVLLVVLAILALVLYQLATPRRFRGGVFLPPGGFGGFGGFGGGGFGGGGGGFGGFGGGDFGGGGAGRSW